jgi:WD40 repeat protein
MNAVVSRENPMKKLLFCCLVVMGIAAAVRAQDADLFWKNGHKSSIISASISPDKKTMVTVEKDTLAIIWDIASGQQLRTIKSVEAARFRDNHSIYLATTGKVFKLINLEGQTISQYSTKQYSFSYSRLWYGDMPRLFYPQEGYYFCGHDVFDINKGWLGEVKLSGASGFDYKAYSPKTQKVAMANTKERKVVVEDFVAKKRVEFATPAVKDPNHYKFELSFSPDGQQVLIKNYEYLQLLNLANGQPQWTLPHGKLDGRKAVFSNDGKKILRHLLTDGLSRLILVDALTGTVTWSKDVANEGFLVDARFSPDNESVCVWLSYNEYEQVQLINAKTGAITWSLKQPELASSVYHPVIEFSADGQQLLAGNSLKMVWVHTATGKESQVFLQKSQGYIGGIYFAGNNTQLVAHANNHLFSWNLLTGTMDVVVADKDKDRQAQPNPFAPAADGKSFFVARNNVLRQISQEGKIIKQFTPTNKFVYREKVTVSHDGGYAMYKGLVENITCGKENEGEVLQVFDTKSGRLVFTKSCVSESVGFMRTKNVLAVHMAGTTRLDFYELPSGKLLYQVQVPKISNSSDGLYFTSDDRYLVMAGASDPEHSNAIIIDMQTKQPATIPANIRQAVAAGDKTAWLRPVGITADDKYMIFYSARAYVFLFLDLNAKQFDGSLMTKDPGNVGNYSFRQTSPVGSIVFLGTFRGTILLYDYNKKQIIGRLYPDAAKKNWAVITPDGSFDGNDGAQANMFHVTGSTVVPISAVFEQFYKPRLLPRLLNGETFDPVPVDINSLKKAPEVKIKFIEGTRNLEIDDDDIRTVQTTVGTASVTVTAECPSDGVTEIRLYQNGKLVETTRNLVVDDDVAADKKMTKTFHVSLIAGANRFRALAFNTQRTESKPVELHVQYKPQQNEQDNAGIRSGIQLHVVVVGINEYKNPKYNLNYAQADAEAFKNSLTKGAQGIYSAVNMHHIQNASASKEGITGALEKVKAAAKAEDVFVFYYAGHGVLNDQKEFYLVPHDVTQLYGNDGALAEKGLSAATLQQFSKDIKAQKQLYILDACQSAGALDNIVALRGAAEEKAIAQLARSTGTHWLTASGSSQFASEFTQIGHGAFTYCLLEALGGKADNGDRKITIKEMDAYLQSRVPEITQQYRGAVQYPSSYGYGNDFPLIMVKQ